MELDIIESTENSLAQVLIGEEKKLFTHSVFCQCILPVRSLATTEKTYHIQHGNASLIIQSGIITNPHQPNTYEEREIPSGAKARLLFAYINDQAIRTGKPDIDMGKHLYEFMQKNKVPVGGKNAKELVRQVKNIAAANIYIGVWGESKTHQYAKQESMKIAKGVSFWIEKNPLQATLWQPIMTLSHDYMAALQHHRVPINFNALVELQSSPRAMDLYIWLSYRISSVRHPVRIPYTALYEVFGKDIHSLKKFKAILKKSLQRAIPYCLSAEIEFERENIVLTNSSKTFLSMADTNKIS